jgi:hypothetical protein
MQGGGYKPEDNQAHAFLNPDANQAQSAREDASPTPLQCRRCKAQHGSQQVAKQRRPNPRHEAVLAMISKEQILRRGDVSASHIEHREELRKEQHQIDRHRNANDPYQQAGRCRTVGRWKLQQLLEVGAAAFNLDACDDWYWQPDLTTYQGIRRQ